MLGMVLRPRVPGFLVLENLKHFVLPLGPCEPGRVVWTVSCRGQHAETVAALTQLPQDRVGSRLHFLFLLGTALWAFVAFPFGVALLSLGSPPRSLCIRERRSRKGMVTLRSQLELKSQPSPQSVCAPWAQNPGEFWTPADQGKASVAKRGTTTLRNP